MKEMGLNDVRESYLKFFEGKGHLRLSSSSLIPKNDKSLLLINAGMAPLKAYFTGMQIPPRNRITTCQKCVRTGDIENVGITSRHATFFEMLGNFSFGDYFKSEIIPWAWEYVTEVLKIPKDKLYVTIYLDDDEAYNLWITTTDIDANRIFRLGKKDNFWEHGSGPCGPCSEIHYDKGNDVITTVEEFVRAGDEDRVVEFWNLVFTQFDRDDKGNYNKLAKPNIDTGMGLERMATIMQNKDNIFEVDTIWSILQEVVKLASCEYGTDSKIDTSIKIITDHIRSIVFMISDSILPSNEGRGYVLRRLLRRAARHGRLLGLNDAFLYKLCEVVIENSNNAYPELNVKKEQIKKIVKLEEERFGETIDAGIQKLQEYLQVIPEDTKILSGDKVFRLYDTYGFPPELTKEILEERGYASDEVGFNKEMKEQRDRARAAREVSNYMGVDSSIFDKIPIDKDTIFKGYETTKLQSKVSLIIKENNFVLELNDGDSGIILTEETPFYAEMGGQIGDTGTIENEFFNGEIINCKKNISGKTLHFVKINEGSVRLGNTVDLSVNEDRRNSICKNHTATHILQAALQELIGDHVHQSGSYVDEHKLRFDFTHFSALSVEELMAIERLVNLNIMKARQVNTNVMSLEEAKKTGAMALFDDKYKEDVRVVDVEGISKEFCGGTHVHNSGEVGMFKIISESGIAAGIRRIEALTGVNSLAYIYEKENSIKGFALKLKCTENEIQHKLDNTINELKEKDKEIMDIKSQLNGGFEEEALKTYKTIGSINYIFKQINDTDSENLRNIADKLKSKLDNSLILLAGTSEDSVQFIAMASKSIISLGVHCGKLVKEAAMITGGNGGGRPDMAQAGGKFPDKVNEAFTRVESILESLAK